MKDKNLEKIMNGELIEDYFSLFISRLVYSNMDFEDDITDLYGPENAIKVKNCFEAFSNLLKNKDKELTEELIIETADKINQDAMFISPGYRKIGSLLGDTDVSISKPDEIKDDMRRLIYNYNHNWKELDTFEREARFNIEFLRIHPFEDGNGRTSRLLLNINVLRDGYAPIIIDRSIKQEYFKARNASDIEWIKNMFIDKSKKESLLIEKFINDYGNNPYINSLSDDNNLKHIRK